VTAYQAGTTTTELMRTYRIGKGTVLRILEQAGVSMRRQGLPADRLGEAIRLYESGLSLKAVGQRLGCSSDAVRRSLLAAGITMRAPWERPGS
jgi:hypothetical protein